MTEQQVKQSVCVVGGGLVGSLMAIFMAKLGYPVKMMEGRKDFRKYINYNILEE